MDVENEILDLIARADGEQFERDIYKLERIVDVGDRLVAQQIVKAAASPEEVALGGEFLGQVQ